MKKLFNYHLPWGTISPDVITSYAINENVDDVNTDFQVNEQIKEIIKFGQD